VFRTYAVTYDRFSAFRRVVARSAWQIEHIARDRDTMTAYVTVGR